MKEFRRLTVWEKHMRLRSRSIVRLRLSERRDLRHQQPNATVQCVGAANIAEGCGRTGNGDFHRFLNMQQVRALNWNTLYCYPET